MTKEKGVARPAGSQPTKQLVNQQLERAENESIHKQLRTVCILGKRMRNNDIIEIRMPLVILEYSPLLSLEHNYTLQFVGKEQISTHASLYILSE